MVQLLRGRAHTVSNGTDEQRVFWTAPHNVALVHMCLVGSSANNQVRAATATLAPTPVAGGLVPCPAACFGKYRSVGLELVLVGQM